MEEVQSSVGDIDNLMETDDLGSGNLELEVEYLKLLGKSLARCVEELLVVSYMMLGGAKENGRNALPKEVWVAIEQSGLDNKVKERLGCRRSMNRLAHTVFFFSFLGNRWFVWTERWNRETETCCTPLQANQERNIKLSFVRKAPL